MTITDVGNVRYMRWDSITEFVKDGLIAPLYAGIDVGEAWRGGSDGDLFDALRSGGSARHQLAVEEIINQIEAKVTIATPGATWDLTPAGAFPCVPAFLAGQPESMFSISQETESTRDPIRIFVNATSSSSIGAGDVSRRGAGVVALALMLSRVRPVEVYVYWVLARELGGGGNAIPIVRLNSHPMMLREVAWALCDTRISRRCAYALAHRHAGFVTAFGSLCDLQASASGGTMAGPKVRAALGATESDLVFGGHHATDPIARDPAAFVASELHAHGIECEVRS